MGEKIRFSKHFQKCLFHNPMLGGKLDSQELEIRRDPLSGRQSIFNPGLRDKVAILFPLRSRLSLSAWPVRARRGAFSAETAGRK